MSETPKTKLNVNAFEFTPGKGLTPSAPAFVPKAAVASAPTASASAASSVAPKPAVPVATNTAPSLSIAAPAFVPNASAHAFVPKTAPVAAVPAVVDPAAARPPTISTEDVTEDVAKLSIQAEGDEAPPVAEGTDSKEKGANSWRRGPAPKVAAAPQKEVKESGWARGVSAPGTMAGTVNDGVLRYDKQTLIQLFLKAERQKLCPAAMEGMYPPHFVKERVPVGVPKENNHTPKHQHQGKTPKHQKHDGKVNYDVLPGAHPDEAVIFSAEHLNDENTFRYKPNRVVDETSPEEIVKKANLFLNQISIQNFEKLSNKFMESGIDRSDDLVRRTVHMIVMKAQLEENFCYMYADLCRKIIDVWTQRDEDEKVNKMLAEQNGETVSEEVDPSRAEIHATGLGQFFRVGLLTTCEEEFTLDRVAGVAALEALDIPQDEKDEKVLVYRKRYLGHMRFIGEVFIQDLVKYNIMLKCVDTLCDSLEEDSLACLCKLMTTIGAKLEDMATGRSKVRNAMESLFAELLKKSNDSTLYSSRIRFMFKDLIDLRSNSWLSRSDMPKVAKLTRPASTSSLSNQGGKSPAHGAPPSPMRAASLAASRQSQSSQDVRALAKITEDEWSTVPKKSGSKVRGSVTPTGTSSAVQGGAAAGAARGGSRFGVLNGAATPKGKGGKQQPTAPTASKKGDEVVKADKASAVSTGPVAPSEDAGLPSAMYKKVHNMLNEYYQNNSTEEAALSLEELNLQPEGMWDIVREGLVAAMDHKIDDHRKMGTLLGEFHKAGLLPTDHIVFGITKFLEGFSDTVMDFPNAGVYLGTIVAALRATDKDVLPPLSFLLSCGLSPLSDGESYTDYDLTSCKKAMAILAVQVAETAHAHALYIDAADTAAATEATQEVITSIGINMTYLQDALGEEKVAASLEKHAPLTGNLLK